MAHECTSGTACHRVFVGQPAGLPSCERPTTTYFPGRLWRITREQSPCPNGRGSLQLRLGVPGGHTDLTAAPGTYLLFLRRTGR